MKAKWIEPGCLLSIQDADNRVGVQSTPLPARKHHLLSCTLITRESPAGGRFSKRWRIRSNVHSWSDHAQSVPYREVVDVTISTACHRCWTLTLLSTRQCRTAVGDCVLMGAGFCSKAVSTLLETEKHRNGRERNCAVITATAAYLPNVDNRSTNQKSRSQFEAL